MRTGLFDALAFSSLWVAAAAGALCLAATGAMGAPLHPGVAALAAAGTLVVYNVDRLRDLDRDRDTSPRRSAFVERHSALLSILTGLGALASALLTWQLGFATLAVLAPVLCLGLLHRRLKRFVWWKPFYVTGAWVAVVAGLPAVVVPDVARVGWVVGVLFATILANVIASNLRDGEAPAIRFGPGVPLRMARGTAALGVALALFGPAEARPLATIPVLTLVALLRFHTGERYGLVAVDGALLVGAMVSVTFF